MIADAEATMFNQHGPACAKCTRKILFKQHEEYRAKFPVIQNPTAFKCYLCNKALHASKPFHMFATGNTQQKPSLNVFYFVGNLRCLCLSSTQQTTDKIDRLCTQIIDR